MTRYLHLKNDRKSNSVSIHYRNVKVFATEKFSVYKGIFQKSQFPLSQPFNYKITNQPNISKDYISVSKDYISVYHSTESLAYLGPIIWELVAAHLKNI